MSPIGLFRDSIWAFFGIVSCFALGYGGGFLMKYRELRRLRHLPMVMLELTPPPYSQKSPLATQQLFTLLYELSSLRSWSGRWWHRRTVFSAEIVSSRLDGIRYLLIVPETDRAAFEQHVTAYMPDLVVRQVEDYLASPPPSGRVIEFRQAGHIAYPLQEQHALQQHDPLTYVIGAMTQLQADETMAIQLVMTPVDIRKMAMLRWTVGANDGVLLRLNQLNFSPLRILPYTLEHGLVRPLIFCLGLIFDQPNPATTVASPLTSAEREVAAAVHTKLHQPSFFVNLRVLVAVPKASRADQRLKSLRTALASYDRASYQALRPRLNFPPALRDYRRLAFRYRLPSLFTKNACLLTTGEVADLFHFPSTQGTLPENLVTTHSRTLAAPLSQKAAVTHDMVIGRNDYHNRSTTISLTAAERERHVYVIGGTGNGKTTLLQYGIVQDMQAGNGVAVIDPHGDLAETILRHVPPERIKDVIYFNPDDLGWPIGLNLLELPPGLEGDALLREKDLVTESTISVFRKIFSDEESGGHRIEYILRNTIQTALTIEGATLFTIFHILNDPVYRRKVVATLENEDLKHFWRNELGKAGEFQRVKMTAGITSKIGRFLFSAAAKRIMEQPVSTIQFDRILDDKCILICNFSKGLLGDDTSALFGITVLAKLQMAALRRARQQQIDRTPYYLYVDEFQNFATASFIQMLSEARKYKLFLTMAEQSTSQQKDDHMVNVILANVGTLICFRTGNPKDERLLLPLFRPYLQAGDIANLMPFNFYLRSAGVQSQEPLSGTTLLLADEGSMVIAQETVTASRQNYARRYVPPVVPPKPESTHMQRNRETSLRLGGAPLKSVLPREP